MRADRTATLPELTLVAGDGRTPSDLGAGVTVLQLPSQRYERGSVVQKDFRPPEGIKVENSRLVVRGRPSDAVRLIPERVRFSKSSG